MLFFTPHVYLVEEVEQAFLSVMIGNDELDILLSNALPMDDWLAITDVGNMNIHVDNSNSANFFPLLNLFILKEFAALLFMKLDVGLLCDCTIWS